MAEQPRVRLLNFKAFFKNTRNESNYTDLVNSRTNIQENKTDYVYDNLNFQNSNSGNSPTDSGFDPKKSQDAFDYVSTRDPSSLHFQGKTNTRPKTVTAVVVCALLVAAVVIAVYFSTKQSEKTDEQPQKDTSIGLSEWGSWSACSVTCGSGIYRRYRMCVDFTKTCNGDYVQTHVCEMIACPVNGHWTTWFPWLSCDITCGGGQQTRYRICEKQIETDSDCVGKRLQAQNCSTWECPDCNRACVVGKLNKNCDACICETSVVEGRITSQETGAPLFEVEIFDAKLPVNVLAKTSIGGRFSLEAVCTTSTLLIKSTGFVETVIEVDDSYLEISLSRIVRPYFIETPQSKRRLIGENTTLCCVARASPAVTSYEWFHNSKVLDESLYPKGTHLLLTKLEQGDSGEYKCRANSPVGAKISSTATLMIQEEPDNFCSSSLVEKTVILPSGCEKEFYDVGTCSPISCRQTGRNESETCRDKTRSCCKATKTQLLSIKCTGYDQDIFVVTSCGCGLCQQGGLTVAGKAVSVDDGTPVKYSEVWVNGDYNTYTNGKGVFKFSPSMETDKIVVTVKDKKAKQFIDAVKVILLSDDMSGTVEIIIRMFKITVFSVINSSTENTVSAGTSTTNSSVPRAELTIPANAFKYPNGTLYNGTVCVCLTFLDPTNVSSLPDIPGQFRTINDEGDEESLASLGLFNIKFDDNIGNDLSSDDIVDVSIPTSLGENVLSKDMKLWTLNFMGEWEEIILSENHRRKKRQFKESAKWIGSIKPDETKYKWINLDYRDTSLKNYFTCFYKVRVYQNDSFVNEIKNHYGLNVDFHSFEGDVLKTYGNAIIKDTSNICFPGHCKNNVSFITVFYQSYDLGVYSGQKLYFGNIVTNFNRPLEYKITDNKTVMEINMTVYNNGPFYRQKAVCEASDITKSHFRVYIDTFPPISFAPIHRCESDCNPLDCNNKTYPSDECRLAWYPKSLVSAGGSPKYSICFVKIRVEFAPQTSSYNHSFKLQASSFGGEFLLGKHLGVRQYELANGNTDSLSNTTLCVEYKCSGYLEPKNCSCSREDYDTTRVHIAVDVPKILVKCRVEDESSDLIGKSQKLNTSYRSQKGRHDFSFHAPREYGAGYGVYYDVLDGDAKPEFDINFGNEKDTAYAYCRAGVRSSIKPNDLYGVAATFYCEPHE